MKLNRNSVGYEINREFVPLVRGKLGLTRESLFPSSSIEFVEQEPDQNNFDQAIEALPYVFRDPIKFDKKVDPRKLRFGSKIDDRASSHEKFYTVEEVRSPDTILLSGGLEIRLLGIRSKPEKREEAIRFLREKTGGQQVFLKFDEQKFDEENRLLCYLYLKNKTFLNAHLVKKGLADVDVRQHYRLRSKFLSLRCAG